MLFTLLPNISASRRVTVNWVWQKKMMYNKSGLAGDWRKSLKRAKMGKCEFLSIPKRNKRQTNKAYEEWNIIASHKYDNRIIFVWEKLVRIYKFPVRIHLSRDTRTGAFGASKCQHVNMTHRVMFALPQEYLKTRSLTLTANDLKVVFQNSSMWCWKGFK